MSATGVDVDRRNRQVVIHLDLEDAEWLATELHPDGFAKDIFKACDELRQMEADRANGPGIRIVMVRRG